VLVVNVGSVDASTADMVLAAEEEVDSAKLGRDDIVIVIGLDTMRTLADVGRLDEEGPDVVSMRHNSHDKHNCIEHEHDKEEKK